MPSGSSLEYSKVTNPNDNSKSFALHLWFPKNGPWRRPSHYIICWIGLSGSSIPKSPMNDVHLVYKVYPILSFALKEKNIYIFISGMAIMAGLFSGLWEHNMAAGACTSRKVVTPVAVRSWNTKAWTALQLAGDAPPRVWVW